MLLGKRQRPPMKRTTSMTKITFDLNTNSEPPPSDQQSPIMGSGGGADGGPQWQSGGIEGLDQRLMATVSPRNNRRYSADFKETASFLKSCYLCNRRLVPARDIYMYRGDSAFCSLECRQQQMNQDERKEKCSLASKKEATSSTKGETVAAL